MSLKRVRMVAVSVLCVWALVVGGGCQYILPTEEEPVAPPLAQAPEVSYRTHTVERGDLEKSLVTTARFQSYNTQNVSIDFGGARLSEIFFKAGDEVKKGDVLMALETDDLDYQVQMQHLSVRQAQNTLNSIKADADYTAQEYKRKIEAEQDPDVQNQLKAQANHAQQSAEYQINNANYTLRAARLSYERLLEQQKQAEITAPMDGRITYSIMKVKGETIDSFTTLYTIADPNALMLMFRDDINANSYQVGMQVLVTLNKQEYQGEVVSAPINVPPDDEALRNTVFIQVDDTLVEQAEIGQEATVKLVLQSRQDVIMLPRSVVRTYQQRKYVQVLQDGIKVEKDIEIGLETATNVEVVSGLEVGEQVIIR